MGLALSLKGFCGSPLGSLLSLGDWGCGGVIPLIKENKIKSLHF